MRRQVGDVEAEQDRSLELGTALAADLVEVGVIECIVDAAGEATIAPEERWGDGHRTEPEELMLGGDGK